jgi:CheY-like chemotaxis protein
MDSPVILVVDDDEPVRLLVSTLLERDSYTVLLASDGRHALEVSRKYGGEIRLLLTDYKMPQMDGLQLAEALIRERPGIRAMIMSGRLSKPEELTRRGIPVLAKPFTITLFQESLRLCLDGPPAQFP